MWRRFAPDGKSVVFAAGIQPLPDGWENYAKALKKAGDASVVGTLSDYGSRGKIIARRGSTTEQANN